jgi:beta-fructofuranosidase
MANQIDYTSKVPQYSFGTTLEQQRTELDQNPLIRRINESRVELEADQHRPIYHYVNPEGTLNDPNGLCFWQGYWHLFYQGYPPEDTRQHWGHAYSKDLIHWRDLPYAIYPNPERCCFSGASLVEEDRVIAMYHGTEVGNMVATSSDPLLLNWEKLTGKPVIPIANDDGSPLPYRVFDPCVWKQGDAYYALSGGTLPNEPTGRRRRADFLFRSTDLVNWDYLHPFVENDIFTLTGDDGACPYFWPIGDKHMLLFFSHMSSGQYILGDYDVSRQKFVATEHGKFGFGAVHPAGLHAPSATPDGKGGLVVLFNMNKGYPAKGWDQIMTLPRRLTLGEDGKLLMEPAGDIESVRGNHVSVSDMIVPANTETLLEGVEGNSIEIEATIDTNGSPMVELNVLRSPDETEVTRIVLYRDRGYRNRDDALPVPMSVVAIDSSRSSSLPDALSRPPETAQVYLGPDDHYELRVFVDRSVVEVFINGKQCISQRVYPGRSDSTGVSLRTQGRDVEIKKLDVYTMQSVY